MIVKIWPVKADYGGKKWLVGGAEGLKNALDYITDDKKTIVRDFNVKDIHISADELTDLQVMSYINTEEDFTRVLSYMANEDKIRGKYITGYLCDPKNAAEEFDDVRQEYGEEIEGNLAYHIVQSFPEELDISDEDVHECGVELCERLGLHQAVICSHVHPSIDEDGEVHGACKHNHILINAYVHPSKIDPENKDCIKYNPCRETYRQLRIWNDEIAIDHGLPIIRSTDDVKTYSWKESEAINKGCSWKERIRMDIEAARRLTAGWDEFVKYMKKNGYNIRDASHVTYTAPDGKHKARGSVLGRPYTKEGLELYWRQREEMEMHIPTEISRNSAPSLFEFSREEPNYVVAIPLGKQGHENRSYYYMPLSRAGLDEDALRTYFEPRALYDICDAEHNPIYSASGAELTEYYQNYESDQERNERAAAIKEKYAQEEEERRRRRMREEEEEYYSNPLFTSSRTKKRYKVRFYNDRGEQISRMEAMFALAIVVLRNEDHLWIPTTIPPNKEGDVIYATTDWKVQNMLDAIRIAREENITSEKEIGERLHVSGAAYSRARAALKRNTHVKEKMQDLHNAIAEYEKTKDVIEELNTMADGPEKDAKLKECQDVLERYKAAKAMMYVHNVKTDEQILDFKNRWKQVEENIAEATERYDITREEYRRLKKLEYNIQLAENPHYCYGPEYTGAENTQEKEADRTEDRGQAQSNK